MSRSPSNDPGPSSQARARRQRRRRAWHAGPAAALLLGLSGPAALAQTGIGIAPLAQLSFGAFAVGSSGTVTVSPAGLRSRSGGVMLVTLGAGWRSAQLRVSGNPDAGYSIELPADGEATLTNGIDTIPLSGFTSSPTATGRLGATGTQLLNVGATIAPTASMQPGVYFGFFTVRVTYE